MIFLISYFALGFVGLFTLLCLNRRCKWITREAFDNDIAGGGDFVVMFLLCFGAWPVTLFVLLVMGFFELIRRLLPK